MTIDKNFLVEFLQLLTNSERTWNWYGVERTLARKGLLGNAVDAAGVLEERGLIEVVPTAKPSMPAYVITSAGIRFLEDLKPSTRPTETAKPHICRRTGEQCPHAGRWSVLESPGAFVQERFFKEGDTFPEGIGRDGKEGPVTWIVMSRDDGGPTRIE